MSSVQSHCKCYFFVLSMDYLLMISLEIFKYCRVDKSNEAYKTVLDFFLEVPRHLLSLKTFKCISKNQHKTNLTKVNFLTIVFQ